MPRSTLAALIAVALIIAVSPASARPKHHKVASVPQTSSCGMDRGVSLCPGMVQSPMGRRPGTVAVNSYDVANGVFIIGGRPPGCPHAYCGCGARIYLGINDTRLNLAWNWTKYYHGSTPVAVWRHHIAIIEKMTGPKTAILRDYNSGNGLSRIHERSISGARIIGMARFAEK